MSSSDISSLSSAQSIETDDEILSQPFKGGTLDRYLQNCVTGSSAASPSARKKRAPSPPHEYVLADNPDIAFIVMFRSRFSGAFPKSLPHYGPQDIEKGIAEEMPDENVERLLCALIGLVLNRKKEVERGHYQRALEDAIQSHSSQWPLAWGVKNPLAGGSNFNNMSPEQRLTMLKALILFSLNSSEAVQLILKDSYKQQRHEDDLNQPLSVQPWGRDGEKRRFWLIEGQDDTHFRLYRESNPALKTTTWRSVAGSIDELRIIAEKLGEDNTQAARRLRERITLGVPRFEASEEKRKRRDYRTARKAQFTRPELGFSLYEGRTRGKRIRYTFSDEEEGASDGLSPRRSNRQSGISTPAEPAGPTFTASGRQVKSRVGGAYGESRLSAGHKYEADAAVSGGDVSHDSEDAPKSRTRTRGVVQVPRTSTRPRKHIEGYNALDEMDDESDASMSGGEWDGGDDDDEIEVNIADDDEDDDADMSESGESADDLDEDLSGRRSLVVSLRYDKKSITPGPAYEMRPSNPDQITHGIAIPMVDTKVSSPDLLTNSSRLLVSDYKPSNLQTMSLADSPVRPLQGAFPT